ncbi:hypothetical protein SB751_32000, partial [Cupriavidus sp. SIMBA_020]|uniref:hypothetical protein n=1 Tax=Cupriavidus sp. SIMBA_020 TaxID=3085766 RepID=UPI0039795005
PIECRDDAGKWFAVEPPVWWPGHFYRVLPKPEELVLPSIDWSHVAPQWKWLVQDEGGVVTLFDHRPMLSEPVGLWGFAAVGGKFLR